MTPRVRLALSLVAGGAVALGALCVFAALRFKPVARTYVISALRQRYGTAVELGNLDISLFPTVHAVGTGLVLRRDAHEELVHVDRFTLDAQFLSFFRNPRRISRVTLEGLEIHMPPRRGGASGTPVSQAAEGKPVASFLLEEVIADAAVVSTTPADPTKDPLVFRLRELRLKSVGVGQPMTFRAKLENPKPPGLIETEGNFGPWNAAEPRATPVSGTYTFRNADLGVFRGISGILSSDGRYTGELDRLEVKGTADVPAFALDTADHPTPLHTDFAATVDGTSGNTVLHPVRAHLGHSDFEVSGSIARGALEKNREINLDAEARAARLEDFVRLAVKGGSVPMTGTIAFRTNIRIPPGPKPVADRMHLAGTFALQGVKFTSAEVQDKLAGLSHRAQGDPNNHDPNVTSDFRGTFLLHDGVLRLPDLTFTLPGTHVALSGTYGVRSGALDFTGTAKLDATVSQMTTGIKSLLLRPLDRFLRRDGAGTELPIRIKGTRGEPSFSLDIGLILKRR